MEGRHIKETIAGAKMRLARDADNEDTWQRYVEVETHRHQDTGAPRALAKVQGKVQATVKAKPEVNTPNMFVLWRGRTQESRLQLQDCDVLKLWKGWSP